MENFEKNSINTKEKGKKENIEKEEILESVLKFTEYITEKWPQLEKEGEKRINYYLSGSLATMLLSKADSFSEIKEDKTINTKNVPESVKIILKEFSRQIGDLDYVPFDHYKTNPTRLKKGGGGPSFDEVPKEAKKSLKQGENQIKVMCDPLESYGEKRLARIEIKGKDYFIARPDTIVSYKILHILQNYEKKPEKFNEDFSKIIKAISGLYPEKEIIETTVQILKDYEDAMEATHTRMNEIFDNPTQYEKKLPKFIENVLLNEKTSPEIKDIIEKIKKYLY